MIAEKIEALGAAVKAMRDEQETRIHELEKRAAREPANDNTYYDVSDNGNVLEHAILSSKEAQDLNSQVRGRAMIHLHGERAAITSGNGTVGAGRSAGTSLVPGHRVPGIVTPADREFTIRDVIGTAPTQSASVEFVRETGFTNSSRPVTEGETKPTSDITFDLSTAPVRTIAHMFYASKQILDDTPGLAAYVGARGAYGLRVTEEAQILNGNGTGQNLNGIIPQASELDSDLREPGASRIDVLRRAIQQVRRSELRANAIVLHPDDWAEIELTKDEEKRFLVGNPLAPIAGRIWGLPVVQTTAMEAGTFLTGAFDLGATVWDRQNTTIEISTEHADLFAKNMVAIRVENRVALTTFRPEAFVADEFGTVVTSS